MNQLVFEPLKSYFPLISDHSSYIDHCLEQVVCNLPYYTSVADIENDLDQINGYQHLNALTPPRDIIQLDELTLVRRDYIRAWKCLMDGKLFAEHMAAGEATRLNLGTKYLINVKKDLPGETINAMLSRGQISCRPSDLLPLSLGCRHMLQYSYDIYQLAKVLGYDPGEVLSKQKMLIVLNEDTADRIINGFIKHKFYGFERKNIMFMIQSKYHGINLGNKEVFYDRLAPKRLHNHGQIAIQQTMSNQIFYIDQKKGYNYMTSDQFGRMLANMDVKVSYNIEDLDYLTGSLDHQGVALALKKRDQDYHMLMEVLPNNPECPQKGGMAAFDPILGKDVMIESFQLNGIQNHQIHFLNKNVNYYPNPYIAWERVKNQGLNMHLAVKQGYIYFQPVLGDVNFLVKTAIFTRKNKKPIKAWKSAATTPMAINCMHDQDMQKDFKAYARSFISFNREI